MDSKKYNLNKYSLTPSKFEEWFINFKKAEQILGNYQKKIYPDEVATIKKLSRGVYLKKNVKIIKNTIIIWED